MKLKYTNQMNRFTTNIKVLKNHLDDLNHVNNVQYLYWAQDIAKSHWIFLTEDVKFPIGIWMVRHHDIIYRMGSFLGDIIKVSTYISNVKGPVLNRIVEFHNKDNDKLLVRICTKWCYLNNLKDRKILSIPNNIIKLINPLDLKVK